MEAHNPRLHSAERLPAEECECPQARGHPAEPRDPQTAPCKWVPRGCRGARGDRAPPASRARTLLPEQTAPLSSSCPWCPQFWGHACWQQAAGALPALGRLQGKHRSSCSLTHARLGPSKKQMLLAGNSERKKPLVSVWPDGECSSSSEREQHWEMKSKNEPCYCLQEPAPPRAMCPGVSGVMPAAAGPCQWG